MSSSGDSAVLLGRVLGEQEAAGEGRGARGEAGMQCGARPPWAVLGLTSRNVFSAGLVPQQRHPCLPLLLPSAAGPSFPICTSSPHAAHGQAMSFADPKWTINKSTSSLLLSSRRWVLMEPRRGGARVGAQGRRCTSSSRERGGGGLPKREVTPTMLVERPRLEKGRVSRSRLYCAGLGSALHSHHPR